MRARLLDTVSEGAQAIQDANYPEPVEHCEVCRWFERCDARRRADDHLSFVAGLSRIQREELETRNIATLDAIANLPTPIAFKPSRGSVDTYERLRHQAALLPKHPMAEAVHYALGQWAELNVFCADGAVPIDNNISEREMKRVVLNRKNSLFVGNPRGGRTAAILASLTSTCRRHGIDPQRYLTQLLLHLPQARMSELSAWLPDQWKLRQTAPSPTRKPTVTPTR